MSHACGELCGLYFIGNQIDKKEVLPAWVTPPFLLCKDNTFLGEMQIAIFRADDGMWGTMAKNCDKVGWGK